MKKTLIIALAGMMLFAFTQCGGNGNGNEAKTVKGSLEYKDSKKMLQEFEKLVKDANTCDELQEAAIGLLFSGLASNEYAEEEKMTEEEEKKLDEYMDEIGNVIEKKSKELGCDEEDEE